MSSPLVHLALLLAALSFGCARAATPRAQVPNVAFPEWVAVDKPNPRKLTVVVRVTLPPALAKQLEERAKAQEDEDEAEFFRAGAQGAFGSGFVVFRQSGDRVVPFVVTNRHVVEFSDRADLELEDGRTIARMEIAYIDPKYDLAVLAFPPGASIPFSHGFSLAPEPPKDLSSVIATGFPGLGGEPSYQAARGYVSNERFLFGDDKIVHFQHTAPTDRGSSGGPLLDERGRLVGVNTFKAWSRENVAFAVPVTAVASALRETSTLSGRARSGEWRAAALRDACKGLGEALVGSGQYDKALYRLSVRFTAQAGLESLDLFVQENGHLPASADDDLVRGIRSALLSRVWHEVGAAGGMTPEACTLPSRGELLRDDSAKVSLRLRNGTTREATFRLEAGRYTLADMSFRTELSKAKVHGHAKPRTKSTDKKR